MENLNMVAREEEEEENMEENRDDEEEEDEEGGGLVSDCIKEALTAEIGVTQGAESEVTAVLLGPPHSTQSLAAHMAHRYLPERPGLD